LLPNEAEVAGLLALLLLTDARRRARTGPDGELISLEQQDRTLWDGALIEEGVALVSAALRMGSIGAYQLQAAIAAVHDEAARAEDTDWPQILSMYRTLKRRADNPPVRRPCRFTACGSGCRTTRWSRSITRLPRRWCRGPTQDWTC